MLRRLGALLVLWALSASLVATDGHATPDPVTEEDKARARALFEKGSRAFDENRYKDAIDLFLEANHIVPDPAFAYNIALAFEGMGDTESALRWSREYLRRAPGAPDRAEVAASIVRFEEHLQAKGVQQVTVFSTPPGATLYLDGRAMGVTPWTGELSPGPHDVRLQLPSYSDTRSSFTLTAERSLDVSFALSLAPATAPETKTVFVETEGSPLIPLGITALALGVAGLGTSLGLEIARANAEEDAFDAPDQPTALERYASAEDFQTAARVTLVLGAVMAAAGAVLVGVGLGTESADDGAGLEAGCHSTGCSLAFWGRF